MRRWQTCNLALGIGLVVAIFGAPGATRGAPGTGDWASDGRAFLERGSLRLQFSRGTGVVRIVATAGDAAAQAVELRFYGDDGAPATDTLTWKSVPPARGEAGCRVSFATAAQPVEASFALNAQGDLCIRPGKNLGRVSVGAPFRYGILPSRQVDDNIYDANDYPDLSLCHLPSEHLFVGLLEGGGRVLACAWPAREQKPRLVLEGPKGARRLVAFELIPAEKEFYLGIFSAPGIWTEVALSPSTVEQDEVLAWRPPFDAAWKTQFTELGTPTTFRLLSRRQRPWRPTIGFHIYPFFMENGRVLFHRHKYLAPEGRALIYALEGHPNTPYAFLCRNLTPEQQRQITELYAVLRYYVLDPNPLPGGMMMNAHCNGRDQLKATTLAVGAHSREVDFLHTHIDERVSECQFIVDYHVKRSLACLDRVEENLTRWEQREKGNPAALAWVSRIKEELSAMRQEYRDRMLAPEPDGVMERVHRAAARFKVVIREDAGLELCPEILAYINELNAVISMEEDMGRRFGTLGRRLFQNMAYQCVADPAAAEHATEARAILRDHLRYRQYESHGSSGYAESLLTDNEESQR
ncbi:MAG: hypothetical protein QHJ73_01545 [Armatimonadota bacterium]|nr:hypothetical protein [Armatimonadota bacterium]